MGEMADGAKGMVVETLSVLESWAIFECDTLGILLVDERIVVEPTSVFESWA